MTRVWDCFTLMNEWDVLDCRLHELQHEIDVFVAVFGDVTQQGQPWTAEQLAERAGNVDRLEKQWGDRIRFGTAKLDSPNNDRDFTRTFGDEPHWVRFWRQENYGLLMIPDADDSDIIFAGDVDEIPRRGMSVLRPDADRLIAFKMRHHVYSWGWLVDEPWIGTGLARVGFARKHGLHRVRCGRPIENLTVIHNGGWHASWFGGLYACRRKINSFTHPELQVFEPALEWAMKYGITCDGRRMFRVSYDPKYREDWPEYLHCGEMKGHWL